jgi:hypothetical protein
LKGILQVTPLHSVGHNGAAAADIGSSGCGKTDIRIRYLQNIKNMTQKFNS